MNIHAYEGVFMNFIKKINNNVALAQAADGHEWIVLGKGIGFGKKAGDPLYSSEIEKRFIAEPSEQFSHVIQTVFQLNPDLLAVVMEVSQHAEQVLGCQFSNYQYLALLDHLHAALNQSQRKKKISPIPCAGKSRISIQKNMP